MMCVRENPNRDARDALDTWPGGYGGSDTSLYTKKTAHREYVGKVSSCSDTRSVFLSPPPFVRCNCTNLCVGSPLSGWLPRFYTPEQYRDWIRRENDLPDYELPPDTKIYVRSKEGAKSWYLTGTMWEYTDGNRFDPRYYWVVIDTIAGRPPEDWKPKPYREALE